MANESIRMRVLWILSLSLALACVPMSAFAQTEEIPLELTADEVFLSAESDYLEATGNVEAFLENLTLKANRLIVERTSGEDWRLEAIVDVQFQFEDSLSLSGDRLTASVNVGGTSVRAAALGVEGFRGRSRFVNESGEDQILYFLGESGTVAFDEAGEATLIEVFDAEVTTCDCCGLPLRSQPYALRVDRLQLYPDRLLVASGLTARLGGVPVFWLPVYVQALQETLESPLFPAFGRSDLRGWYLKWNVPFYVNGGLYGAALVDYYSAYDEIGAGLSARYALAGQSGRLRIYNLPARVGDSIFEFSASHRILEAGSWSGSGSVDYRREGDDVSLDYGAEAHGMSEGWTASISAEREVIEAHTNDEDPSNDSRRTIDRAPEISILRESWTMGAWELQPTIELGTYREQVQTEPAVRATRLGADLRLTSPAWVWDDLALTPQWRLRGDAYFANGEPDGQRIFEMDAAIVWRGATMDYSLVLARGASPFTFDAQASGHRIDVSLSRQGRADLLVETGIDLLAGRLEPVRVDCRWSLWADWTLRADYDIAGASLTSVELEGDWASDSLHLGWSVPYDVMEASFGAIRATAEATGSWLSCYLEGVLEAGELEVETSFEAAWSEDPWALRAQVDFLNTQIDGASVSAEGATESGWGGSITWTYPGGTFSLNQIRYGIFRDFGGCLRVGIDREGGDTWVYLSVLAFPEAILRYAPATSRVQAGD